MHSGLGGLPKEMVQLSVSTPEALRPAPRCCLGFQLQDKGPQTFSPTPQSPVSSFLSWWWKGMGVGASGGSGCVWRDCGRHWQLARVPQTHPVGSAPSRGLVELG